jgi:hypothetical protein
MENYNLIILVIANSSYIYDKFIINYWIPFIKYIENNNYNIKIYFLFDEIPKHLDISEKNIICNNQKVNLIPGVLKKTIFGFEYINKKYNYKHILRTNLSSFFIIDQLVKINKELADKNIYAGITTHNLVSGAGFWLSSDNINYIINNKDKLNYNIIDDLSLFILLKNKKTTKLGRYDYYNQNNFENIYNNIKNGKYYHVRLKNGNRENDIKCIKFLTDKFYLNN